MSEYNNEKVSKNRDEFLEAYQKFFNELGFTSESETRSVIKHYIPQSLIRKLKNYHDTKDPCHFVPVSEFAKALIALSVYLRTSDLSVILNWVYKS